MASTTEKTTPRPAGHNHRGSDNPFLCNVCHKSYTRIDHLARHYRSHTQEKPFSCSVCGKDFSRADLLKRHASSHGDDPGGKKRKLDSQGSKAPRVSQACTACAAAKIRCDEEKPCRRCQARGISCSADTNSMNNVSPDSSIVQGAQSLLDMSSVVPDQQDANDQSQQMNENHMVDMSADQLPTPVTFDQGVAGTHQPPLMEQNPVVPGLDVTDETYLADFLKDIMMPYQPFPNGQPGQGHTNGYMSGTYTPRDVMDFGISTAFDFENFDFASLTTFDEGSPFNMGTIGANNNVAQTKEGEIPDVQNSIDMGSEAFRRSIWRWTPAHERGNGEQLDLACDTNDTPGQRHHVVDRRPAEHALDQRGRDKILGLILGICDSGNLARIVSAFPTSIVLDSFLHNFLHATEERRDTWLHLATLRPNTLRPELISMMVAAGATLSPSRKVRRLGYAIEETVRLSIPKMFENDNSVTRDLQGLQAYALQLRIALWSGNRRKMEIAESHTLPLVTMLRRAGRFRRSKVNIWVPQIDDSDRDIEVKWKTWIEAESWKRLAFHIFILTSQASMALLCPPLISYTEISLDLPSPEALWQAKTAKEWRDLYLSICPGSNDRDPSLVQCLYNISALENCRDRINVDLTLRIVLHAIWSLVWEHRQMSSSLKLQTFTHHWNGPLVSSSWHQELCQVLLRFQASTADWDHTIQREEKMVLELLHMHLHVSFEELQLLAGKEGEEEARRIYPSLKTWVESQSSREAVWHAGQVLRAADTPTQGTMRDFYPVALYHAGLAFWVYGIVSRAVERETHLRGNNPDATFIWLDGDDQSDRHRFVVLQRGLPVISSRKDERVDGESTATQVYDPKAVMDVIISVMRKQCTKDSGAISPLVENLTQLMKDLGNAAWAFGQ